MKQRLLELLAHPNIASKAAVIRLYDHEVQGGTVVKPLTGAHDDGPSDACVLKPIGTRGRRMLFEVTPVGAVSIRSFSAFTGEEEYLLPPGTRLKVADVKSEAGGLCTVKLEELPGQRLVS